MNLKELIETTKEFRDYSNTTGKASLLEANYSASNNFLTLKGVCISADKSKEYPITFQFKGVKMVDQSDKTAMEAGTKGGIIHIARPNQLSDVMVRCSCPDSYFSYQYWNKQNKSLVGPHKNYVRKTKHYPERNPRHLPGLCKHQLKFIDRLLVNKMLFLDTATRNKLSRIRRPKER